MERDSNERMEKLLSLSKRRGFIYQGSEIYGGLAGTWDYGPLGVALKKNLESSWWREFVDSRDDMYGVDAAILMNRSVWESSGHAAGFADPLVEDLKTHKRYRADHLLEEAGVERAEGLSAAQMTEKLREKGIKSPEGNELGDVRQFNLMFETEVGASEETRQITFLRPETAQGIFTNYKNILDSFHPKLPFGVAQIGKAFRNEITPRDWLFRVREFEQMEIEYFVRPEDGSRMHQEWKDATWKWLEKIGLDTDKMRWYEHSAEERSHYSDATWDIQYLYPFSDSYKELWGIANRTDYDLRVHQTGSGVKLEYFDEDTRERFLPHVIEPSVGLGRLILAVIDSAYNEDEVEGESRTVLRFTPEIAPVQVAVLPLMKKDGLADKANEIRHSIRNTFRTMYDESGSIGKRYRRQDEIGTPFAITIDYDTLEDNTVTVRNRDSLEQDRIHMDDLTTFLKDKI